MGDVIYFNEEATNFHKSEANYLDEGQEVEVYKYGEKVFKLFKPFSRYIGLNKEKIDRLKQIKTNRYLLPIGRLSMNDKTIGYASVYKQHYPHCINKIYGEKFIEELEILKVDTDKLSDCKVGICDIRSGNYIYDGSIYISDPGNFTVDNNNPRLRKQNLAMLNDFIIEDIIGEDILKFSSKKKQIQVMQYLKDSLEETNSCYIGDVIKENIDSSKTLRCYTKKLVKELGR